MTVLVAYDGSYPAQKAVKYAVENHGTEDLVFLRVAEAASGSTAAGFSLAKEGLKAAWDEGETTDSTVVADLIADHVDFETEVRSGDPADEIVGYAEEAQVDHVIVGSHGRDGMKRVLLGSVAEEVARRCSMPVTIITG